ncbi:hypothetical protein SAMN06295984_1751 [Sphingopyxis terrae subsp. ummariensis]|uniref:Uncharacterized protein n=1 Tax=Sphingopyxis terrae subsp. ummariensis TaxID=429001 RepID=A0A1Y6FSZ3_9SPHN|nr:hypothetical protein SAMN06295984_1751 [Sphingopyxis terrae subsp. ummariensis]
MAGPKPAAIVLSRAITQDIERLGGEIVHYFTATHDLDVGGRIYIANDDLTIVAVLPGKKQAHPSGVAKRLIELGLDKAAHSILRLDRGEMILSRDGVLGSNSCVKVELGAPARLSQIQLERQIWEFHRKFTQTPSGFLLCWKGSPKDRLTIEQLERQVSGLLAFYLGREVGFDLVSMENYTPHGRVDVKVSGPAMLAGIGPCALELKVLRSREGATKAKSTSVSVAAMIKHASDGVQQAVEYRKDIGATLAYLCCFDARSNDEDQPAVQKLADANNILLRRYFMYESPAAHRAAAAAAAKAGTLLAGEVA